MSQLKKYKRVKYLGKGSYGAAILVELRSNPAQKFVIKEIVIGHLKPKEQESAKSEAEVLHSMNHSNITMYIESFVENSKLYIVMEHADGGDLSSAIQARRAASDYWDEEEVMRIFVQICLALKHVHNANILHRDLKSQNIFLTKKGMVKLGDFGIAKVLDATDDQARTQIGTPYYLSPEICESKPYGRESDVWSLGVLLYELVALEMPFQANSLPALVHRICTAEPNYTAAEKRYSGALLTLVKSMLQKDAMKRPSVSQVVKSDFVKVHISKLLSYTLKSGNGGVMLGAGGSGSSKQMIEQQRRQMQQQQQQDLDPDDAERRLEVMRQKQREQEDKQAAESVHAQRQAQRNVEREKLRKFRQDMAKQKEQSGGDGSGNDNGGVEVHAPSNAVKEHYYSMNKAQYEQQDQRGERRRSPAPRGEYDGDDYDDRRRRDRDYDRRDRDNRDYDDDYDRNYDRDRDQRRYDDRDYNSRDRDRDYNRDYVDRGRDNRSDDRRDNGGRSNRDDSSRDRDRERCGRAAGPPPRVAPSGGQSGKSRGYSDDSSSGGGGGSSRRYQEQRDRERSRSRTPPSQRGYTGAGAGPSAGAAGVSPKSLAEVQADKERERRRAETAGYMVSANVQDPNQYESAARREFFANRAAAQQFKAKVEALERGGGKGATQQQQHQQQQQQVARRPSFGADYEQQYSARSQGSRDARGDDSSRARYEHNDYDRRNLNPEERIAQIKRQKELEKDRERAEKEIQIKQAMEAHRAEKKRLEAKRGAIAFDIDLNNDNDSHSHQHQQQQRDRRGIRDQDSADSNTRRDRDTRRESRDYSDESREYNRDRDHGNRDRDRDYGSGGGHGGGRVSHEPSSAGAAASGAARAASNPFGKHNSGSPAKALSGGSRDARGTAVDDDYSVDVASNSPGAWVRGAAAMQRREQGEGRYHDDARSGGGGGGKISRQSSDAGSVEGGSSVSSGRKGWGPPVAPGEMNIAKGVVRYSEFEDRESKWNRNNGNAHDNHRGFQNAEEMFDPDEISDRNSYDGDVSGSSYRSDIVDKGSRRAGRGGGGSSGSADDDEQEDDQDVMKRLQSKRQSQLEARQQAKEVFRKLREKKRKESQIYQQRGSSSSSGRQSSTRADGKVVTHHNVVSPAARLSEVDSAPLTDGIAAVGASGRSGSNNNANAGSGKSNPQMQARLMEVMSQVGVANESVQKAAESRSQRGGSISSSSSTRSNHDNKDVDSASSRRSARTDSEAKSSDFPDAAAANAGGQSDSDYIGDGEDGEGDIDDDLECTLDNWLSQQKRTVTMRRQHRSFTDETDDAVAGTIIIAGGGRGSTVVGSNKGSVRGGGGSAKMTAPSVDEEDGLDGYRTHQKYGDNIQRGVASTTADEVEDGNEDNLNGNSAENDNDEEVTDLQYMLAQALMGEEEGDEN